MKNNDYDFKIGADPEIFVQDCKGSLVCAHGLVPGTKEKPHKVDKGAIQVDGMALEFNIDPADTFPKFKGNLLSVMGTLRKQIPGMNLFISPVADFGKEYISKQPDESKILGCDPDFNAYTEEPNPTPNAEMPFRTASGHLHIGWGEGINPKDPDHMRSCIVLTKFLDMYVGVVSLLFPHYILANNPDFNPEVVEYENRRRELYGKAGAFRSKPYGLEYRTLSNLWLYDEVLMKCVYYNTRNAITKAFEDPYRFDKPETYSKSIPEIINTNDIEEVKDLVKWNDDIISPKQAREM